MSRSGGEYPTGIKTREPFRIDLIESKPYHVIDLGDINPFSGMPVGKVTYVMGSPGSGKTAFLKRLERECDGRLVIESGVWDLFRSCAELHLKLHDGILYEGFDMPHIDGLVVNSAMEGFIAENTPYTGPAAKYYHNALEHRISSGGKSGFPDYLFIPADGKANIVISFPGHCPLDTMRKNKSIPQPPTPESVIFLVDPMITDFDRYFEKSGGGQTLCSNAALFACHKHLGDVLEMEADRVPVHWYPSKTPSGLLTKHGRQAAKLYSQEQLEKWRKHYAQQGEYPVLVGLNIIGRRAQGLPGFDSFESTTEELLPLIKKIL